MVLRPVSPLEPNLACKACGRRSFSLADGVGPVSPLATTVSLVLPPTLREQKNGRNLPHVCEDSDLVAGTPVQWAQVPWERSKGRERT